MLGEVFAGPDGFIEVHTLHDKMFEPAQNFKYLCYTIRMNLLAPNIHLRKHLLVLFIPAF